MKNTKISAVLASAALLGASAGAQAVTWQAGDWTLGLGGNVNGFYTLTFCDGGDLDALNNPNAPLTYAGLACLGAVDENGSFDDTSSVQNGLLPASLNFSANSTQAGWDISANINVYYGIANVGDDVGGVNSPDALEFNTVDARQVFMTFGKKDFGTIKIGRDFGLFAYDAIINDMTLLGAGATLVAVEPGHTTFGSLGYGYVYTDRLTQINYTSPNFNGFNITGGIFQPLDGAGARSANTPGFHAKLAYGGKMGGVDVAASATYLYQEVYTTPTNAALATDSEIRGFDVFLKLSSGPFSGFGYYYDGKGMTGLALGGLLLPAWDPNFGNAEDVDGWMVQGTYTMGKTRFGINYGTNDMDDVNNIEHSKWGLGVYHNLTPALTLVGEYSWQEGETQFGDDQTSNINLGAIIFF